MKFGRIKQNYQAVLSGERHVLPNGAAPWRSKRLAPEAILVQQARSKVRLFNREEEYQPYKMRW